VPNAEINFLIVLVASGGTNGNTGALGKNAFERSSEKQGQSFYFPFRVLTPSEKIRCFSSERAHQIREKIT
jgi:hypothetical protein